MLHRKRDWRLSAAELQLIRGCWCRSNGIDGDWSQIMGKQAQPAGTVEN